MNQIKDNGLVGVGSKNGTVSFFSPNSADCVLKVLAHNGRVNSFDFYRNSNYMVSVGSDKQMKVFDIRNTFKEVGAYFTPFESRSVRVSQTNLAGVSFKNQVFFWKDLAQAKQKAPYLKHEISNDKTVLDFQFVPFEDFAGLTFSGGFQSIVCPCSGLQKFDTFRDNFFYNKKQK